MTPLYTGVLLILAVIVFLFILFKRSGIERNKDN